MFAVITSTSPAAIPGRTESANCVGVQGIDLEYMRATTLPLISMTFRGLLPADPTRPSDRILLVLTHNLGESLANESIGDPDVIGDELHAVD